MTAVIDIPALADALAFGDARAPEERRLALATYRALADGVPVAVEALAQRAELPLDDVAMMLEHWPGVERDRDGRVVGYGLTLEPTGHEIELDGTRLCTWCALDTLLFPLLLGTRARVRSTPPSGGETVTVEVGPAGVRGISPLDAAMSLVRPSPTARIDAPREVRGRFCCFVHFFASAADAQAWTTGREGTFVVSIEDGSELARRLAERISSVAVDAGED